MNKDRNIKVVTETLKLYKDQKRILSYKGNLIKIVAAGIFTPKHNRVASIVILDNRGYFSWEKTVNAFDLFDNLKIVK
mgnify:CR=1 FL=1